MIFGIKKTDIKYVAARKDQIYKLSVNEWYNNIADSATVFAHELGHALGIEHDFNDNTGGDRFDKNGVSCTYINGIMDYGARSSINKFTTCSREDFRDYYNNVLDTYNSFCLSCGKISNFDHSICAYFQNYNICDLKLP